ncbi:MAG: hypothetical protein IKX10_06725 [Lachnospiraceae bacterium]|nr:hypothetical protein [Lachnospiraceae bacterium]
MGKKTRRIVIPIALLLILGIACIGLWSIKITAYRVDGNERYTDEEIFNYIFPTENDRRYVVRLFRKWFKKEQVVSIPFVESYEVDDVSMREVSIVVYEKSIIAYMSYMGDYLYLDSNGYVAEVSSEPPAAPEDPSEGNIIPHVEGLDFGYFVKDEPLPVEDPEIFRTIVSLAGEIQKKNLPVSLIRFTLSGEIILNMDRVHVYLGTPKSITGKIRRLAEIYPKVEGQAGSLILRTYDNDNPDADIIFKKDEYEPEDGEN